MSEAWAKELAKHPFHSRKLTAMNDVYRQARDGHIPNEGASEALQGQGEADEPRDLEATQSGLKQAGRGEAAELRSGQDNQSRWWKVDSTLGDREGRPYPHAAPVRSLLIVKLNS